MTFTFTKHTRFDIYQLWRDVRAAIRMSEVPPAGTFTVVSDPDRDALRRAIAGLEQLHKGERLDLVEGGAILNSTSELLAVRASGTGVPLSLIVTSLRGALRHLGAVAISEPNHKRYAFKTNDAPLRPERTLLRTAVEIDRSLHNGEHLYVRELSHTTKYEIATIRRILCRWLDDGLAYVPGSHTDEDDEEEPFQLLPSAQSRLEDWDAYRDERAKRFKITVHIERPFPLSAVAVAQGIAIELGAESPVDVLQMSTGLIIQGTLPEDFDIERIKQFTEELPTRLAKVIDEERQHERRTTNTKSNSLLVEADPGPPEHKLPRMEVTYGKKLGAGAFGSVWHATDALLGREIAVKFLTSTDQAMDENALIREAQSLARLKHSNLVTVYAAAWLRHPVTKLLAPALIMEMLHGETLDKWWSRAHEREEVIRVASGIVAGIRATHAAGLIHGDVHEGNVMVLDEGVAKLIDWRYHDTFLERSTSHRQNEMEAEQRRVVDRVDTLFLNQGLEPERSALRNKQGLQAIAAMLEDALTQPQNAATKEPQQSTASPARQKLDAAIAAARTVAVVVTGGVADLTGSQVDAVNGEIHMGNRGDVSFELRIPCGHRGIPVMTVPYELLRTAWVDAAGRLNVALEWPLAWNGREVTFNRR